MSWEMVCSACNQDGHRRNFVAIWAELSRRGGATEDIELPVDQYDRPEHENSCEKVQILDIE